MADRLRKSSKDRVNLNCQIDAETKLYLIRFAGEFGLGWAIDQMVEIQRKLATDPQQRVPFPKVIQ